MNVLVVYAHPNPKSFNHAILESVQEGLQEAGHVFRVKDLYSMGFKTTLDGADFGQILSGATPEDIKREQDDVTWAEGMIFIHPVWWFGWPAVLKGWVDRVFLNGFAFAFGPEGIQGLLHHRKAAVFCTTGGDEAGYAKMAFSELITRPMADGTLRFCGIPDVTSKVFYGVPMASDETRKAMLAEAREIARNF